MSQTQLATTLEQLRDASSRQHFSAVPDLPGFVYAVWLDDSGADELSAAAPEPIPAGIVYAGECVTQSVRRHLMHNNIGSLTLMKNLAAILREPWSLCAQRRGTHLVEPGRRKLLDWMDDHLTATIARRTPEVPTAEVLAALDPPLRLKGWRPERTSLRQHITGQRSIFDSNP